MLYCEIEETKKVFLSLEDLHQKNLALYDCMNSFINELSSDIFTRLWVYGGLIEQQRVKSNGDVLFYELEHADKDYYFRLYTNKPKTMALN